MLKAGTRVEEHGACAYDAARVPALAPCLGCEAMAVPGGGVLVRHGAVVVECDARGLVAYAPEGADTAEALVAVRELLAASRPGRFRRFVTEVALPIAIQPANMFGAAHLARGNYEVAIAAALTLDLCGVGAVSAYWPYYGLALQALMPLLEAACRRLRLRFRPALPPAWWFAEAYVLLASAAVPCVLRTGAAHAALVLWATGRMPLWAALPAAGCDATRLALPAALGALQQWGLLRGLLLGALAGLPLWYTGAAVPESALVYAAAWLFEREPPSGARALRFCLAGAALALLVALTHIGSHDQDRPPVHQAARQKAAARH